ncbi:hypothetical protein [Zymobacter sp. IVIA_5232.4 C2]|uniref:hypothetical protein n=1 Tax=Zymobacter sp. IVIA_5232.4 C2 TaxID=3394855 RepID=UPI0039C213E3
MQRFPVIEFFTEKMYKNWQLATGNWQLATGNWQLATGNWQLATGNWQLATGNWQLATGNWQLATGNWQLATGNWQRSIVREDYSDASIIFKYYIYFSFNGNKTESSQIKKQ